MKRNQGTFFLNYENKVNFFISDIRILHSDKLVQREERDYILLCKKGKLPKGNET